MEQYPNDKKTEQLPVSLSHYCGLVHEADGSYPGTVLAAADLLVRQFHLTYIDAVSFVKGSGFFNEQDTSNVIREKSALAPLLLTSDLLEMQTISRVGFYDGDQTELINSWYSDLASIALGIAGADGHSLEDCCADSVTDSVWRDSMACMTSDNCALRTVRQFLLQPALQPDPATIFEDTDILLQHIIVEAKLSAAVDHEFIIPDQKEVIDASYMERTTNWGRQ
jgi:hypothetical protein